MTIDEKRTTKIEYLLVHDSERVALTATINNDEIEKVSILIRPIPKDGWNNLDIRTNQVERLRELQEVIAEMLKRLDDV